MIHVVVDSDKLFLSYSLLTSNSSLLTFTSSSSSQSYLHNIPGARLPVIGEVDEILIVIEGEGHLVSVEGPRTEFHETRLLIEGEVRDVDGA